MRTTADRRPRPLFSVGGVPIRAEATLWVIAFLVTWSFWSRFATTVSGATAVVMALVAAALFLASILAHELAHALEAKRRGLNVEDITLYIFGGATEITTDVSRPADEFALTIVGPWTSIVLGCGFGLLAHGASSAGIGTVAEVAGQLGWLNVILGVFNLLPGAPLDGGRLLEATVWRVTGDRARATAVSTLAGQVLGLLLAGLGLSELLFVTGGFIGGLWLMLIGWFIVRAAGSERALAGVRSRLSGHEVREIATSTVVAVPVGTAVGDAVGEALRAGQTDVVVVTGPDGVVGVFTLAEIERFDADSRWRLQVEDVMKPVDALASIQGSAPAPDLLPLIGTEPVIVLEGGAIAAVVTSERLTAALRWLTPRGNEQRGNEQESTSASAESRPSRVAADRIGAGGPRRRGSLRRSVLWAASGAVVVASLAFVPMPVLDVGPGPAIDLPSSIVTGGPDHRTDGKLLLTSVRITSPSAFGVLYAWLAQDHELLTPPSLVPTGIDPAAYEESQRQVFRDSIQLAAGVALRAAGYSVRIAGGGAIVQAVGTGGPAEGKLRAGDIITGVNGRAVSSSADLISRLQESAPGALLTLQVLRDSTPIEIALSPAVSSTFGRPTLNIAIEDAPPFVELPFSVRVRRTDIGGPSAGLMAALAIYTLTTGVDLTHGRTVAGTGTIDREGNVGQVGAVTEKVASAAEAGATVFLVPTAEASAARRAAEGRSIRVVPVDSFDAALAALKAQPVKGS